jgi:hypothetical protein
MLLDLLARALAARFLRPTHQDNTDLYNTNLLLHGRSQAHTHKIWLDPYLKFG